MASRPDVLLQTKIYDIINADVTLATHIADRIYDTAPDNPTYPFITLGETTLSDWSTHTTDGFTGSLTIKVHTQSRGRNTAHIILNLIYGLLHDIDLALTGFPTINFRCNFNDVLVEPDNRTFLGVQTYDITLGGN